MDIIINKTVEGTRAYPHHRHKRYEIMHYVKGTGEMWTERGTLPFSEGTVIIMPPDLLHGSHSEGDFVNISIEWDFGGLLATDSPTVIPSDGNAEGEQLARMIWENRLGSKAYLHALCIAYAQYLLQKIRVENDRTGCIKRIVEKISDGALSPDIRLSEILRRSGYAEDYVRACFKSEIGKTPTAYLTELRIKHACYLIDVYRDTLPLSQIAERCGYTDYVYFSKKFKEYTGLSPRQYRDS